jgi:hypothetical protein
MKDITNVNSIEKIKESEVKYTQPIELKQDKKNNNYNLLIAISNDTLILMKSETEIDKYLIEGEKTNAYLVEGATKDIVDIIHNCYNARERKIPYVFEIDNIYFSFI